MQGLRTLERLAAVIAAAVLTGPLAMGALAADPVKIGYSTSRTGFLAQGAIQEERARVLWREQVNARGGLDIGGKEGRPIEFVVYDDQSDAGRTPGIYEKLIVDDSVDLLLTPYATPLHLAITPTVERHKFPVVGDSAISSQLRELGGRYMFFPAPEPGDYAKQLVSFLVSVGVKSVTMMTLELPMSLELRQHSVPMLKDVGIKIVSDQRYPPTIKDMTSILTSFKAAKPDALIAFTYPADGDLYLRQAREIGIDTPIQYMMLGPAYPFLIKRHGEQLDGVLGIGQWSPHNERPGSKEFFDAYIKRWDVTPDYATSAIAWVALEILEQAVANVGLDREKLRDHIATASFETIMGPVKFEGPMGTISAGVFQSQGGEAHLVWPPEIATREFQPRK